ncbi:major facilitator superfamily MFS_1 [Desulfatibacillum aliphaticivorans]|uniref:Major facilitator superfamily MFS_1 n=1 Tax=Desulfatibacillum aliphaticivorans TaxID=218208 RepID=B8FMR8_DESAL|nr:MFS transporter [Desulfatibacillum aliphaticivorans]ACL01935.1 major facilitator superfamily MFS_1 [Desulfatibacillum aliphaticivorans]
MENQRCIVALNIAVFLIMFGVGLIVSLLPHKIFTLTGSFKTVGWLASFFAVSFVLLQFPIGRLSDRYGFKRFLAGGYLICSLSGLLYWFSQSQETVFFGRMLQGAGEAPLWALAPALLCTLRPESKGKAIGVYNASLHLGLTLGSGFGIVISSRWLNNEPFLLFALLCALGALLIIAFVQEPESRTLAPDGEIDYRELHLLIKRPETLAVLSGIILYGAGYGSFITVLPGFLMEYKGFSQAGVGWFFMFFYTAVSLSQIVAGPMSDRCGSGKIMLCGLAAAAAGLVIFPCMDGWTVHPWLFLASWGLGMFCVSSLAWLNNAVGDSLKGTASGAFYLFWGLGYFGGPIILGACLGSAGGPAGFRILAGLYLITAMLQGGIQLRGVNR